MTKKTRLIIFLSCVACFFVVAPILVFYSMGYRLDFETLSITETGGIYVRTFPAADNIVIDSKIANKPGLFANSIFVQSLLPKNHIVTIQKAGYYSYQKTLPVEEKQVTKLENVLLIKKDLTFADIADNVDYFSVANDNQNVLTAQYASKSTTFNYFSLNNTSVKKTFTISSAVQAATVQWSGDSRFALIKIINSAGTSYYVVDTSAQKPTPIKLSALNANSNNIAFNPQNSRQLFYDTTNLYTYADILSSTIPKATLLIDNVLAYKISNNTIYWLSSGGLLMQSDISGQNKQQLSLKAVQLSLAKDYQILLINNQVFLKRDSDLLILNQDTNTFDPFVSPTTSYKILLSPDGQNLVYYDATSIYLYSFADKTFVKIYAGNQISDCYWLNNYYVIFADGNNINISEIDYRGNINTITLPNQLTINQSTVNITSPQIFYNRQNNQLYILTQGTLTSSEKLVP